MGFKVSVTKMDNLKKGTKVLTPHGEGVVTKVWKSKRSIIDNRPLGKRYTVKLKGKRGEFSKIVYPYSELRRM